MRASRWRAAAILAALLTGAPLGAGASAGLSEPSDQDCRWLSTRRRHRHRGARDRAGDVEGAWPAHRDREQARRRRHARRGRGRAQRARRLHAAGDAGRSRDLRRDLQVVAVRHREQLRVDLQHFYDTVLRGGAGQSEFLSLADLIAKAKTNPGTVTFGSAGPGSTHHLGIELLAIRTGTKFLHVPYRGDAPVVGALLRRRSAVRPGDADAHRRPYAGRDLAHARGDEQHPLRRIARHPDGRAGGRHRELRRAHLVCARRPGRDAQADHRAAQRGAAQGDRRARGSRAAGRTRRRARRTTPQEMRDRVARELAIWTTTVNDAGIPKQ